jgi:nucleoside-diphosphate-sugar epimerase
MPQTLLVTGGGGFVLSHLVRQWLDADAAHRAVVVDLSPLDAQAKAWFEGVGDRMTFVRGSVTDPALWDSLPSGEITHICHSAAVTSIKRLMADGVAGVLPALETNALGGMHALAFAERCPGLVRHVHVSTGSVYGLEGPAVPGAPLPEDGFIGPDGLYGISKYAGEQLVLEAAAQRGLPVSVIRLSSVFGPMDRETAHRAVALPPGVLLARAIAGEPVKVTDLGGAGDYIHAGDVARAVRALFEARDPAHSVYNVANGTAYTMGEMVALVASIVPGFRAEIVPAAEADIVVEPARTAGRYTAYAVDRMAEDTGWTPRPLAETLRDYHDWLVSRR